MGRKLSIMESSKKIPIKIIKYEDLLNYTYVIFTEILEFINKITNNSDKLDKEKLKNLVNFF